MNKFIESKISTRSKTHKFIQKTRSEKGPKAKVVNIPKYKVQPEPEVHLKIKCLYLTDDNGYLHGIGLLCTYDGLSYTLHPSLMLADNYDALKKLTTKIQYLNNAPLHVRLFQANTNYQSFETALHEAYSTRFTYINMDEMKNILTKASTIQILGAETAYYWFRFTYQQWVKDAQITFSSVALEDFDVLADTVNTNILKSNQNEITQRSLSLYTKLMSMSIAYSSHELKNNEQFSKLLLFLEGFK
jgi:hypothetical protein